MRAQLRWLHIITGVALGAYIYSPLGENPAFAGAVAYGFCPAVALSGIWMWKGPKLQKLFSGRQRAH